MYEIALTVSACLRAATRVNVAWVVDAEGFGARDRSEALAITPGGGRVGSVLAGALGDQLVDLSARGGAGRIVDLHVGAMEAELAGLPHGGDVRCLLVAAADLPAELWERLREREPVCLLTRVDGDRAVSTALFGPDTLADAGEDAARLFARGVSDTLVRPDAVVTVLFPVPKLLIVGAGAMADALSAMAGLLGWHARIVNQASAATGMIAGLAALDKVVVMSHDDDVAGTALAAALSGPAGYIGSVGPRRVQQSRADWLAYRGVTDVDRVHAPAGLDIGANTPPEVAVAVLAEALAVRSRADTASLRDKSGSAR